MAKTDQLCQVLLAHLAGTRELAESDRTLLPQSLTHLIEEARTTWPELTLSDEVFVAYLAARLPAGVPLHRALRQVHAADLFLACACLGGDPAALEALDARYLPALDPALARLGAPPTLIEEVKQELLDRLVLPDGAARPLLENFAGQGQLAGWLRVLAIRLALKQLRGKHRDVPLDEKVFARFADNSDPELGHLKRHYLVHFRTAFREALKNLTDKEQNLLKHHYGHGLNPLELGVLLQVHRTTAGRWLAAAERRLLRGTRKALMTRLKVPQGEIDSIMRLIRSQMDASMRTLLSLGPRERSTPKR